MKTAFIWSLACLVMGASGCATVPRQGQAGPPPGHTNAAGVALIKGYEKFRAKPYRGVSGTWLIGYGHALRDRSTGPISQAQAEALLHRDLALCEAAIREEVQSPISSNEFSAMASLCYTTGAPAFRKSSLVGKLNRGDRRGAADAFLLYTKAKSEDGSFKTLSNLEARRRQERALFLTADGATPPMS